MQLKEDQNRPHCCGRLMNRHGIDRYGQQRYWCRLCDTRISWAQRSHAEERGEFAGELPKLKPSLIARNEALWALTGHFPRVGA